MIRITLISLLFGLLWPLVSNAQDEKLDIGDTFPDIEIGNIINGPSTSLAAVDRQGKLLILYFWNTWCGACIASMPKIRSLQREFGDSVLILPVTRQSKEEIVRFWRNNNKLRDGDVPLPLTVVGDTLLSKYFPHEGVPHMVWIGGGARVMEFTWGDYLKAKNIRKMLRGEDPDWVVAKSNHENYAFDRPLLKAADNGAGLPERVYYTALTTGLDGLSGSAKLRVDSNAGTVTFHAINLPIINLYNQTLKGSELYGAFNKMLVETSDSSMFFKMDETMELIEWSDENSYCYDAVLPLRAKGNLLGIMRDDLDRFLGLRSSVQDSMVDCLVIKSINGVALQSVKAKLGNGAGPHENRISLDGLVRYMNKLHENPIIVLDGGVPGECLVSYPSPEDNRVFFTDIAAMRKILEKHGYSLVPERRELRVLTISEVD